MSPLIISPKYLQNVFKMSPKRLQNVSKTSPKCVQNVSKMSQKVLKKSLKKVSKVSKCLQMSPLCKCLQNVFKMSPKCVQEGLKIYRNMLWLAWICKGKKVSPLPHLRWSLNLSMIKLFPCWTVFYIPNIELIMNWTNIEYWGLTYKKPTILTLIVVGGGFFFEGGVHHFLVS